MRLTSLASSTPPLLDNSCFRYIVCIYPTSKPYQQCNREKGENTRCNQRARYCLFLSLYRSSFKALARRSFTRLRASLMVSPWSIMPPFHRWCMIWTTTMNRHLQRLPSLAIATPFFFAAIVSAIRFLPLISHLNWLHKRFITPTWRSCAAFNPVFLPV